MQRLIQTPLPSPLRALLSCAPVGLCLLLVACDEPVPRTFADFMEDSIARDGTLARCNANPEGTLHDLECAQARRAAASIALREEREKRAALELESQRKIDDLKQEMLERERIATEVALAAARAEREAYEAMWRARGAVPDEVFGPEDVAGSSADLPGREASPATASLE
jgi:hypothetical protein